MAEQTKRSARKGGQGKTERPGAQADAKGVSAHVPWGVTSAVVLAVIALGLAAATLVLHFADEDGEEGGTAVTQPTPTVQPTPTPPVAVSADDDPFIGPDDALVTIIEFNDFQ